MERLSKLLCESVAGVEHGEIGQSSCPGVGQTVWHPRPLTRPATAASLLTSKPCAGPTRIGTLVGRYLDGGQFINRLGGKELIKGN